MAFYCCCVWLLSVAATWPADAVVVVFWLLCVAAGRSVRTFFFQCGDSGECTGGHDNDKVNFSSVKSCLLHNHTLTFYLRTDLVPKENAEAWVKYLRNEFPTVAFKASTQTQNDHLVGELIIIIIMSVFLERLSM